MKKIVLVAASIVLLSLCACDKSVTLNYKNRLWTVLCNANTVKFNHIDKNIISLKYTSFDKYEASMSEDVIMNFKLDEKLDYSTAYKKILKIDGSTMVYCRQIDRQTTYVSRRINGKSVWCKKYPSGDIFNFDKDLYMLTENTVIRISFENGSKIWSASVSDFYNPCVVYSKDNIFVQNVGSQDFTSIDNKTGEIIDIKVTLANNNEYLGGAYGRFPRILNYYIDSNNQLVCSPSEVICQLPEVPEQKATKIMQLNNAIIIVTYIGDNSVMTPDKKFPNFMVGKNKKSHEILSFKDGFAPVGYKCDFKIVDLETMQISDFSKRAGQEIKNVDVINNRLVVYYQNMAYVYDSKTNLLVKFPYNQLVNPLRDTLANPKILWVDEKHFLVLDNQLLSSYKIE